VRKPATYALGFVAALLSSVAAAQSTLGDLLDAGATRLSADAFKEEVVQHTIVGPTSTGGTMEVMYVSNGSIQGKGTAPMNPQFPILGAVRGEWKIDDADRVCAAMVMSGTVLPPRCQYWFKLGDAYFISDSDSDRRTKVLQRTIKQ